MGRQPSCTNLWRWNPPEPARMSGAIWLYKRSIGSSDFFSFSDNDFASADPRSLLAVDTPRSWTQQPQSARLICYSANSIPQPRSSSGPVRIVFFTESDSQGPVKKKTAGQRVSVPSWERAHTSSDPKCLALATQRGFSRPFFPTWPASLCQREQSGLVQWKWRIVWLMTACHWQFRTQRNCRAR